jgi:lysophospholipase L1-like esterase
MALAFALIGTPGFAADAPEATPCQCARELMALGGALPHATAELRDHRALKVVALGSSTTYGTGASGEAATYPSRMAIELGRRFPGVQLEVINKGVPGEVAGDMMRRLDRDVIGLAPDLVIWQTGTNDALRDLPIDEFAKLTIDGVQRLHQAGIDVVLMEPQYSPKLQAQQPQIAQYVDALRTIAHTVGAPVLRRFAIMKDWMASGQFDGSTMLANDNLHMKDASYACLGTVVADSIADAIDEAVKSPERLTAGGLTVR